MRFGFAPDLEQLKQHLIVQFDGDDAVIAALRARNDLFVDNTNSGAANVPDWCVRKLGALSVAVLPIVVNGTLIGALYIDSLNPCKYTERELELIQSLRNQVALAIKMKS